jgi:hypothetical protein
LRLSEAERKLLMAESSGNIEVDKR